MTVGRSTPRIAAGLALIASGAVTAFYVVTSAALYSFLAFVPLLIGAAHLWTGLRLTVLGLVLVTANALVAYAMLRTSRRLGGGRDRS